ncbi:MAG: GNAT family N-acetyltransferase [Burkholderiales bacterium]|nr:GNAT family N-acetyltransferase [Burkholderiales bacterium]
MQFRPAFTSEAELLTQLARRSKAHWNYTSDQLLAWRDDLLITADTLAVHPCFVADDGAQLAGFFVMERTENIWTLAHFWIAPECMGKGLGRALLHCASGIAKQGGATALQIDADPNAEAFYAACGAVTVRRIAAPIAGDAQRCRPQMLLQLANANDSPAMPLNENVSACIR